MDEFESCQIITIAHGAVHAQGSPEMWGEDGYAAIVFKTTEQAERALRVLAMYSIAPTHEGKAD